MSEQKTEKKAFSGKTYSLFGKISDTGQYYSLIKELTGIFLQKCPDEKTLLSLIQKAGKNRSFLKKFSAKHVDRPLISFIKKTLKEALSVYTGNVKHHLKTLPISQRLDPIIATKEEQYHLYMVEIDLVNRIYKNAFKKSEFKFSLIAHCLRDFRPDCSSVSGDIEAICKACTNECFINLAGTLLKEYDIHPYISVTMEFEKLFKKLKAEHRSVGALGIACVPELAQGMRLCIKLGIPPIGIPLDANRCARWIKECRENSFDLGELEELVK